MAIPMRPVRSNGPALRDGTIEVELPEGFGEGGGKERLAWLRGKAGCMVNRPGARFLQGKKPISAGMCRTIGFKAENRVGDSLGRAETATIVVFWRWPVELLGFRRGLGGLL